MTPAKIRLVSAAMGKKGTNIANLCEEIGISRATLYRHVSATGEIRAAGQKILK
jgi:DNA-binding phage protein